MYATAIIDAVEYGQGKSATRVTLCFPPDLNLGFSSPSWTFEYGGPPQPSHHAGAVIKLDLTGGDDLKRLAFEKISSMLPMLMPLAMQKLAGKPVTVPSMDLSGVFQSVLGSFSTDQLDELQSKITAERTRRLG